MTTSNIQVLDPLTAPLQGISLIEASAGTGKTYTISTLLLRLLLEKNLTVDKILVVTFTEAATEDLRTRVRGRLHEALVAFQQNQSEDKVLTDLIQQYTNHEEAIFRLSNALRGFDEAAIFTIHSFCRQMLYNNAFESGALFDTELVSDQTPLLREVVEDFWRQYFYAASPLFITYTLANSYSKPANLLKTLNYGQYVGQPFLKIIPQYQVPLTATQEEAFYTAFTEAQQVWRASSTDVEELLTQNSSLNRSKYRETSIPLWCKAVDSFLNAQMVSIALPEKFEKFTASVLAQSVKKGKVPPQHEFFDVGGQLVNCTQTLSNSFKQHILALKVKLFEVAEQSLARKKLQRHIQSFDDLLINLYKALQGRGGEALANLIRGKYQAALIDEFQDTDPVQYHIFHTIYGTGQHTLFLIGDPKQAIYSFRGADIFTYMVASRQATYRHTLDTNWRSEENLIAGVNKLFEQAERPFIFADIAFHSAQAPVSRPEEQPRLQIDNLFGHPLQIWFVSRSQAESPPDKPIKKAWAEQQIPRAVGYEIARLLTLGQHGQARIGDKPLIAGDIAILVRTNFQARLMQKKLTQLRIPSVLYSRESLFASHEVMEIERVLLAIADASHEGLMKAALTTDMLGWTSNELHELLGNDRTWQQRLYRFQKYHSLWQNVGFIQMFRELLWEEQVQERLLSYPDGERRLTNVLHTAEVLQQATMQQKLGISGLCQWLSQQRQSEEEATEEEQLRLESDEKLVKIVTIHKSKGLEYPIVFCPFVWDGRLYTQKHQQFTFHGDNAELILDLGSEEQEQHRDQALLEEQAENLRLFYVAVTRAKHRCYLVWGAFNDANTSAPAHLLHPKLSAVEKAADDQLWTELTHLAEESGGPLQVSALPMEYTPYQRPTSDSEQLKARPFLGKLVKEWKVASFSSLTAATATSDDAADRPDYDEITVSGSFLERDDFGQRSDNKSIFSFPRGARAGNFIHALFENLDFTQLDRELIANQLRAFGYEVERWEEVIVNLVTNVVNTPLSPQRKEFTLSRISRERRLNELEFYYPLPATVTRAGLQAIFGELEEEIAWQERLGRLEFSPVRGFMKGFIDMVFEAEGRYYLVDYKSNFLGTHQNNYHHRQLATVMTREAYFLQYHLYAVALHRYLSVRLPDYHYERHFGGVYYLFVRGMQPSWGANYGIYRDLPTVKLINRLSEYLARGNE